MCACNLQYLEMHILKQFPLFRGNQHKPRKLRRQIIHKPNVDYEVNFGIDKY